MKVADLTREQKIDLIKRLASGEVYVINGNIVEPSPVIIAKGDKFFMGDQEFSGIDDIHKLFPIGQGFIILPEKNKTEEE